VVVLDHGERIAAGSPAEVTDNPDVIRAYLGSDATAQSAFAEVARPLGAADPGAEPARAGRNGP
jgi:hypothetical protein